MRRYSAKIAITLISTYLAGCSALITATGTDEEDLIWLGASKNDVQTSLGEPIKFEVLSEPQQLRSIENNSFTYIVTPEPNNQASKNYAVEKGYYKYIGNIQGTHDVGELVSVNLMTLGLFEILAFPMAVDERMTEKLYLIEVWLDSNAKVTGYRISEQKE